MSYLSDFEHAGFDAEVSPGTVIQTHYISDSTLGQRRVPKTHVWNVERRLGKGGFGEVRLEVLEEDNNQQRAVKRIWATGSTFRMHYERELKALLEFSKPKYKEAAVFVEFFGWFEDPESVYLAMEYVPLGDLEHNVAAMGGRLVESDVRDITVQILEGLKIMHLERFVHRDLKPKNVLVCRGPPRWWVKLADFGLSKRRTEETGYRTQTGTQAYMAPEILNYIPGSADGCSEYTDAVDIWALGCIVYRLATGVLPFPPGLSLVTFCRDESSFPSNELKLSELGEQFARKLIVSHPTRRLTAREALVHPWTTANFNNSEMTSKVQAQHDYAGEVKSEALLSFGAYNTETHAGLQSYATRTSPTEAPVIKHPQPEAFSHPKRLEGDGKQQIEIPEPPNNISERQVLKPGVPLVESSPPVTILGSTLQDEGPDGMHESGQAIDTERSTGTNLVKEKYPSAPSPLTTKVVISDIPVIASVPEGNDLETTRKIEDLEETSVKDLGSDSKSDFVGEFAEMSLRQLQYDTVEDPNLHNAEELVLLQNSQSSADVETEQRSLEGTLALTEDNLRVHNHQLKPLRVFASDGSAHESVEAKHGGVLVRKRRNGKKISPLLQFFTGKPVSRR